MANKQKRNDLKRVLWYCVPDPGGKLKIYGMGFEVKQQASNVNYKLAIPNRKGNNIIVHVNRMNVLKVVVADENNDDLVTMSFI